MGGVRPCVPGLDGRVRGGIEASGLDLPRLCFDSPIDELTETEIQQPALVATCLACLRAASPRHRAWTSSSAIPSESTRRSAV